MKRAMILLICAVFLTISTGCKAQEETEIRGGKSRQTAAVLSDVQLGEMVAACYDNTDESEAKKLHESWYVFEATQEGTCCIRVKGYSHKPVRMEWYSADGSLMNAVDIGSDDVWETYRFDVKAEECYYLCFTCDEQAGVWGYIFSVCANGKHKVEATTIRDAGKNGKGIWIEQCAFCGKILSLDSFIESAVEQDIH